MRNLERVAAVAAAVVSALGGRRSRSAMLALLTAVLPPAVAAQEMPPPPSEITGRVMNGTTRKPIPGFDLSVVSPGAGGMEVTATVKTAADGKFVIPKASELLQSPHLLQAEHQSVTYTMMLRPGMDLSNVELRVYDTASTPDGLKFSLAHMMVRREGDTLRVDEIFQIENPTDRTFLAPGGTFKFELPPSVKDLSGVSVTPAGSTMPMQQSADRLPGGQGYKIDSPIKPGRTQVRVEYTASYAGGKASLPHKFLHPMEVFNLAVSPEDVNVSSNLLHRANNEVSSGFNMLTAEAIPAGKEVTLDLSGGSSRPPDAAPSGGTMGGSMGRPAEEGEKVVLVPPDISHYNVLIVFNVAVLLAAFVGWRLTSRDPGADAAAATGKAKGPSRGRLLKQREALMDQLARLDESFEAGAIPSRQYQEKRQTLKGQLIEIVRHLEKEPPPVN